jgi:hypothetical protein
MDAAGIGDACIGARDATFYGAHRNFVIFFF